MAHANVERLMVERDDLQARIGSIESGLRYYDRSAQPHETGEDRLPGLRAQLAKVQAKLAKETK